MKKIHVGVFEVNLDEQTRFEDEVKALSQKEVFQLNRIKSSELKVSKTTTVAKGSTEAVWKGNAQSVRHQKCNDRKPTKPQKTSET